MDRVTNKLLDDLPSATLYLEDLSEILNTFTSTCKKFEVEAGEYRITDLAELGTFAAQFPDGRFPDIYIRCRDPFMTLDLRSFGARAYISEDSLEQRGVISKIMDILQRRKKLSTDKWANVIAGLSMAAAVILFSQKAYQVAIPLVIATFALGWFSLRLRMNSTIVVYTKRKSELTSFWTRKKDDIALATVSASLAAAATYLFTKLG